MLSRETVTITSISILEDPTWPDLRRALDPIIHDSRLRKVVIVSADKVHQEKIRLYAKMYFGKIILLEEDKEKGRAHLFSKAIFTAKEQATDYVLFLEHDAVPQPDFLSALLDNYKYFNEEETKKSILLANTIDIFGNEKSFYGSAVKKDFKDGTVFDLLSWHKISKLFRHLFHIGGNLSLPPIFKTQAYIGGGTFIPRQALLNAEPPNDSLFKYGEDTDYAWKLKEVGYSFYQCAFPVLKKPSSEKKPHHIFGLFNNATGDKDVYYHIRNAILISRKHTYQSKPLLFINIAAWILAACILGVRKVHSLGLYMHRVRLILRAAVDGYKNLRHSQ